MSLVLVLLSLATLLLVGPVPSQAREEQMIQEAVQNVMKVNKIQSLTIGLYDSTGRHKSLANEYYFRRDDSEHVTKKSATEPRCIGGISRGFTAILLKSLLDKSNYTWESPVEQILGYRIEMPSLYISSTLNLKDILTMRSGLAGMDIVPMVKPYNSDYLIRKLKYVPQVTQFRDGTLDNEVLFGLVDDVVGKLAGVPFERAIEDTLLTPLKMRQTEFVWNSTRLRRKPLYSDLVKSASGLCSTGHNMLNFFPLLASNGMYPPSKNILQDGHLDELFEGVISRSGSDVFTRGYQDFSSGKYGRKGPGYTMLQNTLGWILGRVDGMRAISLDGHLPMHDQSLFTYLPEKRVGVFVSFTGAGHLGDYAAKILLTQLVLKMKFDDYKAESRFSRQEVEEAYHEMTTSSMSRSKPIKGMEPCYDCGHNREPNHYEGVFRNYAFGDVKVTFNESGYKLLTLEYGTEKFKLSVAENFNDTFKMTHKVTSRPFHIPMMARFKGASQDSENRIVAVTIVGFDRNVNPEFSLNPREPSYEKAQTGCSASAALAVSAWCCLAIFLVAVGL